MWNFRRQWDDQFSSKKQILDSSVIKEVSIVERNEKFIEESIAIAK